MAEKLLTVAQVADWLGIKPNTLHQWRCKGVGPLSIKIGTLTRYQESDVADYLERRAAAEVGRYAPGEGEGAW
jgi:predicted DNA-binding transcriptional regulator AlpA